MPYTDFILPKRFDQYSRGKNLPLRLRLTVSEDSSSSLHLQLHTFTLIAGNDIWDGGRDYLVQQPILLHTGADIQFSLELYHERNLHNLVVHMPEFLDRIEKFFKES